MVVSLFTDRRMLDHQVPARHPERPERLQAILRHLERTRFVGIVSPRYGPRSHADRACSGAYGGVPEPGERGT